MGPTALLLTAASFLPFVPPAPLGVGVPSCDDPTTPCPPGSTSGQQPDVPGAPGYAASFGTPSGGCGVCIADPQDPGGRGCVFSQWTTAAPTPTAPLLSLSKFQPPTANATLVQAELRVSARVCGVLRVENRDPINQCFANLTLASQVDVAPAPGQGLDFLGALMPSLMVSNTTNVTLGPYDGTLDFQHTPPPRTNPSGFASGTAFAVDQFEDGFCVRITDPTQLAAFVDTGSGPDALFFDHSANDASSVIGCAPITFKSDPFAGVSIDVVYTYCSTVDAGPVCEGGGQVEAAVGEELVLSWTGNDSGGRPLSFSVSGLPFGAVVTPDPNGGPYPVPLDVDVTWTPNENQTGSFEICVTFSDAAAQTAQCCYSVNVSECHLLIAAAPGNDVTDIGGHVYTTQVQGIQETYSVMMGMNPSFALHGPLPNVGMDAGPMQTTITPVPVRQFVAQVVMFNPPDFPSNPEQSTQGLAVTVWSDGTVTSQPYGTSDNMILSLRTYSDANGNRFYSFPFTIVNWPQ